MALFFPVGCPEFFCNLGCLRPAVYEHRADRISSNFTQGKNHFCRFDCCPDFKHARVLIPNMYGFDFKHARDFIFLFCPDFFWVKIFHLRLWFWGRSCCQIVFF
ncbi:hypothetical protein KSP39_PZI015958 [Platanthera zijinensis]|uniref:Uncharacterized protein n=1 Tax=Platanthera zijinensis TaxID=2320716 RepID=A0AAP0G1J8_9ASPA